MCDVFDIQALSHLAPDIQLQPDMSTPVNLTVREHASEQLRVQNGAPGCSSQESRLTDRTSDVIHIDVFKFASQGPLFLKRSLSGTLISGNEAQARSDRPTRTKTSPRGPSGRTSVSPEAQRTVAGLLLKRPDEAKGLASSEASANLRTATA